MKRFLLLLAGICAAPGLWAATYVHTGTPFPHFTAFYPPCAAGPCANYPPGSMLNGWFTTAAPLAANLPLDDISALVTSYFFTDGINTYSSADPNARIYGFLVATDGGGNISGDQIEIQVWKTGSAPHAVNDRASSLGIIDSTAFDSAKHNLRCLDIGSGTNAGLPDTCQGFTADAGSSEAWGPHGTWSSTVTPVVGLWWNPAESGSGYNLDVKHGVLVMTVYSYKPTGEQEWYITSGPITGNTFTGTLNRYVGGQCISCAYNGLPTASGTPGVVSITFTTPVSATMSLPGGRVTTIQPQAF